MWPPSPDVSNRWLLPSSQARGCFESRDRAVTLGLGRQEAQPTAVDTHALHAWTPSCCC